MIGTERAGTGGFLREDNAIRKRPVRKEAFSVRQKATIAIALLLALLLGLSQCGPALAYSTGVWPSGYEEDGCPAEDALVRNDGRHFFNCREYVEPSCEYAGHATFVCVYCGATRMETYPAAGHIWSDWFMMDETSCEENGVEARYCARCQAQETRSTPPRGHDWGEWDPIEYPTCTEPGEEIRYCGRCWQEQSRPIPALGHDWGPWYPEQAATCTAGGSEIRYCYRCQDSQTRATSALGHAWGAWQVTKQATCSEAGVRSRYCANDPAHIQTEAIPALNHAWGPWRTEIPGTCVEKEMKVRACANCGAEDYRYFDYGDHVWGEWYTAKAPTETEQGLERRECRIDPSHVEEREIPPTSGVPYPAPGPATGTPTQSGEKISLSVVKPWDDGGDADGLRPDTVTVALMRDGAAFGKAVLSAADGWDYGTEAIFDRYDVTGREIEYTWEEIDVPEGYEASFEVYGNQTFITNTHVSQLNGSAEQDHGVTYVVSWDEGVGEGKRYEGAVIPLYLSATNTGSVPIRSGDDVYQPGESDNYTCEWIVTAAEAEDGVVHTGSARWVYVYEYQDAEGNWIRDTEDGNKVVIPLTYPDGEEPEEKKPELTLTYLYDDPAKDVYDPEDEAFAYYSLVNTGNVPLKVAAHFTSDGVVDYDRNWGNYDPGESDTAGWGWWTIRDGVTPGTETEDLLGTVTIHYYFMGFDPDTGEELCRTQTISRTWKVAKPIEGPAIWLIPEESDITMELTEYTTPADPNGYQLGEYWSTTIAYTNTGYVDIPEFTVYDPYDGYTGTGNDLKVSEVITSPGDWTSGKVTQEDVERGSIYLPPVQVTWIDPDSGNEKIAYSNDLTLKVTGKTGLLVQKGIAKLPANGAYFTEGEQVEWVILATNNSEYPITGVTVTDQGKTAGVFAEIAPGQTVECRVDYIVTEYDTLAGFVSNAAEASGTDFRGAGHIWPSNIVIVPTSPVSPVPVPGPIPKPGDPGPGPGKGEDPGGPKPEPGKPETPTTPGTPGGGEDPKGPIYGYKVAATLYKTTAHGSKNGEYYELGETVHYIITLANTGETPLEDITIFDSLAGIKPIATAVSLAPGLSIDFPFSYAITQADIDLGYVVNGSLAGYTFGGGIPGTPIMSNLVYVVAGKDGKIPDPTKPGGGLDGGTTAGLIPPVHFDPDKLHGTPGAGKGPVSCELQLDALGGNSMHYTLHACAAHTAAAQNAEAASAAGDWKKAADIWRAEIEALYELLHDAADSEGKAAALNDRSAFEAYASAFQAVYGDEAAAGLLRLYCAKLCCMVKTAPESLPDSILGDCGRLTAGPAEKCGREFSALNGSDAVITERFDEIHGAELEEVIRLAQAAKYGPARENAFIAAQRRWQMALDSVVNAQYKAADKETRKLIAAWRVALDSVYAARKDLLGLLYPDAPEFAAEALSSLYKDALIDACGR